MSEAGAQIADETPITWIVRPANFFKPLPLEEWFDAPRPLEVELGAGDGGFLTRYAGQRPDRNFIGVERLLGRLRKIDRKARRLDLRHIRLLRVEAAYFLEYLLPASSTSALHLYFPDPWPKRRHWKNRLVNERFPDLAARSLVDEGVVYLRTDHVGYFDQMNEVFQAREDFESAPTPEDLAAILTDFELEFQARGVRTNRTAFRKRKKQLVTQ